MPDAGLTGVPATLGLQRWGGALSRLQPPQTGAPWVGPGPLPSLEEWKAKPWESWSSVQASSPAAPSRRRSDTAGTAVWICEHRRQEGGTGAAALPRWDLPEDWRYVWASALWRGAGRIDHASPSFPALPPQTHQPFSTLRLRQAATGQSGGGRHWSGQWSWRQRRDAECVWGRGEGRGVGARGEGLRPRLRRAPRSTPSPGGRPGSQARAPRLGQAPRLPSRGDHPGTQRSTLAPSRRPPAPLPRPGAASACPAGPCPSPRTPSGDPGARPEEQGAAGR